jgi:hypothetical protein
MNFGRYLLYCVMACTVMTSQAEEQRGLWGWLTDVTSSAWEGTKNTVNSIFGGGSSAKQPEESQKKVTKSEIKYVEKEKEEASSKPSQ